MLQTFPVGNAQTRSGTTGLSRFACARIHTEREVERFGVAGSERIETKRSLNKLSDHESRTATHRMTPDLALFPCSAIFVTCVMNWGPGMGARLLVPGCDHAEDSPALSDSRTPGFGK